MTATQLEQSSIALDESLAAFNAERERFVWGDGTFGATMDAFWHYVSCKTQHNNDLADFA